MCVHPHRAIRQPASGALGRQSDASGEPACVKVSPASRLPVRKVCTAPRPQDVLSCFLISHRSVSSFQGLTKDMVTDFDEKHDEYLILLQQRNR